jgi:hypothetical protein
MEEGNIVVISRYLVERSHLVFGWKKLILSVCEDRILIGPVTVEPKWDDEFVEIMFDIIWEVRTAM